MDMMQSIRIHSPCAASEQTDKAGSVSQSFHQNLPQGRPDIHPALRNNGPTRFAVSIPIPVQE